MQKSVRTKALTLALALTALTAVPGAWTMAITPASDLKPHFGDGSTQRLYETRFEDSFPFGEDIRHAWAAVKLGILGEPAAGAILGNNGVLFTEEEFREPEKDHDFRGELQAARTAIEALGAKLIPVIIPDKARMMAADLPRQRSAHFADRYSHLMAVLSENGFPAIDLRPALSDRDSYMVTDTHWSPLGAMRVAKALAPYAEVFITSRAEFEVTRELLADFRGDLVAFADTGRWRSLAGPIYEKIATYQVAQVNADSTDALGLFDDFVIPVALVGTSFSAREDFYFPEFFKAELQADLTSYALEGLGPFEPMHRFLHEPNLSENPPQVVIWEIPERYINTWSKTHD